MWNAPQKIKKEIEVLDFSIYYAGHLSVSSLYETAKKVKLLKFLAINFQGFYVLFLLSFFFFFFL